MGAYEFKNVKVVEFVNTVTPEEEPGKEYVCLTNGEICLCREFRNGKEVSFYIAIVEKSFKNLQELFNAGYNFGCAYIKTSLDAVRVEIDIRSITAIEFE